jgi:hypothetical protein
VLLTAEVTVQVEQNGPEPVRDIDRLVAEDGHAIDYIA